MKCCKPSQRSCGYNTSRIALKTVSNRNRHDKCQLTDLDWYPPILIGRTAPVKYKHERDKHISHGAVRSDDPDSPALSRRCSFCQPTIHQQQTCLDCPSRREGKDLEDKCHLAAPDGLGFSLGRKIGGNIGGQVIAAILGDLIDADDNTGKVELSMKDVSDLQSQNGKDGMVAYESKDHEIIFNGQETPFSNLHPSSYSAK